MITHHRGHYVVAIVRPGLCVVCVCVPKERVVRQPRSSYKAG